MHVGSCHSAVEDSSLHTRVMYHVVSPFWQDCCSTCEQWLTYLVQNVTANPEMKIVNTTNRYKCHYHVHISNYQQHVIDLWIMNYLNTSKSLVMRVCTAFLFSFQSFCIKLVQILYSIWHHNAPWIVPVINFYHCCVLFISKWCVHKPLLQNNHWNQRKKGTGSTHFVVNFLFSIGPFQIKLVEYDITYDIINAPWIAPVKKKTILITAMFLLWLSDASIVAVIKKTIFETHGHSNM